MLITIGSQIKDDSNNIYTLDEILGKGGFGTVYKAHRQSDGEIFAVKTLSSAFESPDSLKAFQNEIKQAALIKDENVIHYEYTHDGTAYKEYPPYIIMEYANEGTLSDLITQQRNKQILFQNEFLVKTFQQLAYGMSIISKVIVHRDIKPDNILLKNGCLKISDFGLSKVSGERTRTLTFKGYGTAKYTAPEAWSNDRNTIQMDIYSMGIVFYELATLRYPYNIQPEADIITCRNAHLYEAPVNPTRINEFFPSSIVSVIVRMLEKPTQKRFSNWEEIIDALQVKPSSIDSINQYVEQAVKTRNDSDLLEQKKRAEKEKHVQEQRKFLPSYTFTV